MGANSIGARASVGARTAAARSSRPSAAGAASHKHIEPASTTAAVGLADAARAPRASREARTDAPAAGAQALQSAQDHATHPGAAQPTIYEGRKKNGKLNLPPSPAMIAAVRAAQNAHADATPNDTPVTKQVLDSVTAEAGITIDEEQLASPQAQEQLARIEERLANHADDPKWLNILISNVADNLGPDASLADVLDTIESIAMMLDGWVGRKKNG